MYFSMKTFQVFSCVDERKMIVMLAEGKERSEPKIESSGNLNSVVEFSLSLPT